MIITQNQIQAQTAPHEFNYQGVARNSSGNPLAANTLIRLHFEIWTGSPSSILQFAEDDTVRTGPYGIFTMRIGSGMNQTGNLGVVNWQSGYAYMTISMDPTGGTSFIPMGQTPLVSVPYALHAENGNWKTIGNDIINENSGHVIIGTQSSSTANVLGALDVNSDGTFPGISIYDSSATSPTFNSSMFITKMTQPGASEGAGLSISSSEEGIVIYSDSTSLDIHSTGNGISANVSGLGMNVNSTGSQAALFHSQNNLPAVQITNSVGPSLVTGGNVGIGMSFPSESLTVLGNINLYAVNNSTGAPTGGSGTMRFNSSSNTFEGWNGTAWTTFGVGSSTSGLSAVSHDGTLSGDGSSGNPLKLANGNNVNDVLKWTGTTWVSANAPNGFTLPYNSGSLNNSSALFTLSNSGSGAAMNIYGKSSFSDVFAFTPTTAVDISGLLRIRDNQNQNQTQLPGVIRFNNGIFEGYNGTAWVNFGAGAGDNWGTQVVQSSSLFSGNGTSASPLTLAQNGATSGQVLSWNGSTWAPATVSGGGGGYWAASGNDIYNTNTGKFLWGITSSTPTGTFQVKTNANSFGIGAKFWSNISYATTMYVADSSASGGPIGCGVCSGNNALNAYTKYGTAVFAHSPSGDGLFAYSGSGNAIMVDGTVKDAGSKFAIRTPNMPGTNSYYNIPASFSNNQNDILVITPVDDTNYAPACQLYFDTTQFNWVIATSDGSTMNSTLSFNIIKVSK